MVSGFDCLIQGLSWFDRYFRELIEFCMAQDRVAYATFCRQLCRWRESAKHYSVCDLEFETMVKI